MSKVIIEESSLQDIADSIREKNGSNSLYKPSEMSEAIDDIESVNDYISGPITGNSTTTNTWQQAIKKLPPLANTGTSCQYLFCGFKGTEIDTSLLNTSNVTNMSSMFSGCPKLTSLNVSGFDTSSVTNMSGMFGDCPKLTSLNVSGFDTSSVTNMSGMFYGCSSLTSIDLSHFDTSSCTNIARMFGVCSSLTSLDLSNFDISNVNTALEYLFYQCSKLTTLNLSNWNTSKVTSMNSMFYVCEKLTSLDLSSFTFKENTNVSVIGMFSKCKSLMHLDIRGLDFTNITSYGNMFGGNNIEYVPANCEIIVKDNDAKSWLNTKFPRMTNVKTVAEYESD